MEGGASTKRGLLLLVFVLCTPDILRPCSADDKTHALFYSSPGDATRLAGLYGGPISAKDDGQSEEIFKLGYHCTNIGGDLHDGLTLESIAHDRETSEVLLQPLEEGDGVLSLYRGPVCSQDRCLNNSLEVLFHRAQMPNHWGPFAVSSRDIYFIYQSHERLENTGGRRNVIEVRRLTGCEDKYPVLSTSYFSVDDCSVRVAVLGQEDYSGLKSRLRAAKGLTVARLDGGSSSDLHLLSQLHKVEFAEGDAIRTVGNSYSLMAVSTAHGTVRTLHTVEISRDYLQFDMHHLGAIDVSGGAICWTAVDRVLCGNLSASASLSGVRQVLPPGKAGIVCKGRSPFSNVTTGVAVRNVKAGSLELYFGCMADTKGVGGAGFLRWSAHRDTMELFPVRNDSSMVFAGSLFLSDRCYGDDSHDGDFGYLSNASTNRLSNRFLFSSVVLCLFVILRNCV